MPDVILALLRIIFLGLVYLFVWQVARAIGSPLGIPVRRPMVAETTALGAAYLAGLAVGYWKDRDEIRANWQEDRRFEPAMDAKKRDALYAGWQRAVERARGWETE